jgi:hypothetical protein
MVASGIRGIPHPDSRHSALPTRRENTMDSNQVAQGESPNPLVPVQAKLAAAWTSFMFFYIYVDYLHLYKPGIIDDILAGVVFKFDISQTFVVIGLMLMAIPILMILLSMTLPARANRTLNLVVASLYIPVSAFNVASGEWILFYGLGVVVELIILAVILRSAWTWPRAAAPSMPGLAAPSAPQLQMGR